MVMAPSITTEDAIGAASRMIYELVRGLVGAPSGLADVMDGLAASLEHADDPAEAEIARQVIARLELARR